MSADDWERKQARTYLEQVRHRQITDDEVSAHLSMVRRENERRKEIRLRNEARQNAERQARIIAAALVKEPKPTRTSTARHDRLDEAIRVARDTLKARLRREPTSREVIASLQVDAAGAVEDYTDDKIVWADASGKLHDTKHKSVAHRLTRIRKQP